MMNPLLAEWEHEAASTRKILERVPDDKLDWKPHDKSKTLGQLAQHIAQLPFMGVQILEQQGLDFEGKPRPQLENKEEILAAFDNLNNQLTSLLNQHVDMSAQWTFKVQGKTVLAAPRAVMMRSFFLNHLIHHRGQLSVYLRLLNVPVPGIYGPSADEN